MRRFSYDQQYKYMNKLCVYKGENVFPSFQYVENGSSFYLEPDQLDLIEDVASADQVEIIGKPIDPTQPAKMPDHVPALPALPAQQAEVNAADLVPSKPAPAIVPATVNEPKTTAKKAPATEA